MENEKEFFKEQFPKIVEKATKEYQQERLNREVNDYLQKNIKKIKQEHLDKINEKNALKFILDHYGIMKQVIKTKEEMWELYTEIERVQTHLLLKIPIYEQHLITEIADVEIMLKQLKMYFGIEEKVEKEKEFKIKRTLNRIAEVKEDK